MLKPIWGTNAITDMRRQMICRKLSRYISVICIILIGLTYCGSNTAFGEGAQESAAEEPVLYYFWGRCPVCAKPEEHLDQFDEYPINLAVYEVFYDQENRAIYDQLREELGIEAIGFPTLIYQDQYWLGFSPATQTEIRSAIEASLQNRSGPGRQNTVSLPLFGEVNLNVSSILLATVIISFLDGFNPCSLFVLTFLLAMIVHSASRKRIFVVGFTFLIVTAAVYGLFILGVLNVMIFAAQLFWIRNIVALLVIVMGLVGIKDFLFFKKGFSFSIPDRYKAVYYRQVRNVFYAKSTVPMIAATTLMALGIALIELPCTAGFPFVWSSLVAGRDLSLLYFILLFVLYLCIYLSIELVIFVLAIIRMRSIKLTEERGRVLKLVAGSLMLVLGLILLFRPDYMENMLGVLLAFGATAVLMLAIYLLRKLFMAR